MFKPTSSGRFFNLNEIKYSGYPIVNTSAELENLKIREEKPQVLYIHQPLIKDQFSDLSFLEEAEILNEIGRICESIGMEFIVKLHPRDDIGFYKDKLIGIHVEGGGANIHEMIAESKVILGHFSTALFTAIVLKKHFFLLDNWKINIDSISYFDTLNRKVTSVQELSKALSSLKEIENRKYDMFQVDKIGYGNTNEDRVNKLKSLICEN